MFRSLSGVSPAALKESGPLERISDTNQSREKESEGTERETTGNFPQPAPTNSSKESEVTIREETGIFPQPAATSSSIDMES